MSEHASSDVAALADAVHGLTSMVKTRTRKLYREADELRRLSAQMETAAAALCTAADTEGSRNV